MQRKNLEPAFFYMKQLLDRHKSWMEPQAYRHGMDVIARFYHWYCGEDTLSADDLYVLIYEGEDGGLAAKGDASAYCNADGNEALSNLWDAVLSTLMVMVRFTYQTEGAVYVPEDLEAIRPEKIDAFLDVVKTQPSPKELLAYLKELCY